MTPADHYDSIRKQVAADSRGFTPATTPDAQRNQVECKANEILKTLGITLSEYTDNHACIEFCNVAFALGSHTTDIKKEMSFLCQESH
jgi:hypothetical protein